VALSTIPAAWVGREPPIIAGGLADALVGSLNLDFAFVRLCDPQGTGTIEITRGEGWKAFPEWLQAHLDVGRFLRKEIVTDIGDEGPCRGLVIPIGVNAEAGLVAAACSRTDFPSEVDQLLLSVAANHAAAAFQNARLRQVIQRSETRLREVIESINEGMCVVGTDGLIELWNRGAEESLRRKRQDVLGHPLLGVFPELQESRLPPALTEARRSGATLVLEDLQLTLEGTNHIFLARVFPFEGGTTIFFNDVGERKRAEKVQAATFRAAEAANAASSLEDLFRSTHSIVRDLMPAKNLYVSLYNPYTETLSFPYFVDEHYPTPAPRKLKKGLTEYVLRTGKAFLTLPEIVGELKEKGQIEDDGAPSVCWLGVPIKKGEDSVGVLAVHSYTEGVTFGEEEQKILTFVAAQMVMAIERMRAEAELKSALQMKSDFVSFATHQLRTPLAGIRWSLELAAQEGNLSEETASFIEDGRESAQRLIGMVNGLLDISRIESGKLKLAPEETNLAELTQSVLTDVSHYIEKQGHHLSVSGMEGIPAVQVDPQLFRQVILNMVSNAIKYTPSGGKIDIRMGRENGFVRWAITDSGIGIPKASQARLFEKFYRADNVYKIETEGTGLGLHLAKLIVENSGGRIWCESEENKGSTFQFTLPLGGGNASA
jgi:PAS domain S-box-containing protein